jgi:4-amino-4-deoxy-L-arabinose transferase
LTKTNKCSTIPKIKRLRVGNTQTITKSKQKMNLKKNNLKIYSTLILCFIFLYLLPLNYKPLISPDETRYAEISREIINTGNWIDPHLGGIRYFEKPIMGYWMNSISMLIFGESNFGIRFASAFATGMVIFMLFTFIKKRKGIEAAFFTSIIFLTSLLVYSIGTFAVLDAHLSMFITGALLSFFTAYGQTKLSKKILWLSIFGIFCGFAFLTKGFLGFIIPALTIIPFLIWKKEWKYMLRMPWLPLFFIIIISLPWAIMIKIQEPDFWHYFIVTEHIERFIGKNFSQHTEPFWFYIPILIVGTMPSTVLLPAIFSRIKFKLPKDDLIKYCLCWIIFPLLFFSMSKGKLGTYILPLFPAISYLIYIGSKEYFEHGNMKILNKTCKISAALLGILLSCLALSQIISLTDIPNNIIKIFSDQTYAQTSLYLDSEIWKWITGVLAGAFWCAMLYIASKTQKTNKKITYLIIAPLLMICASNFLIPQVSIYKKSPKRFLQTYKDLIPPDATIITYPNIFTDVTWYYSNTNVLSSRSTVNSHTA